MSEVKSAREVARKIQSHGITFHKNAKGEPVMYDRITTPENEAIDLILSDRRAIIEKCKELIDSCQFAEPISPSELYKNEALAEAWVKVNNFLSEIEKEE